VAVSADPPEVTREHLSKTGWTYIFLSDADAAVIRRYGLLHKGAGVDGKDIARPAELLIDPSGTVRWINLTGDFRVRARPEEVLRVFDQLSRGTMTPSEPG
jgi:peroxiredoxin